MAHLIHFHSRPKPKPKQSAPAENNANNVDMTAQTLREWRYVAYVLGIALILLLALVEIARAGGPQYVAGVGYFNTGLAGQPVTWTKGAINYYTDMGSLSPILNGAAADAFVADAFSRWTSISTAALSAARSGQLAEDVSGANVIFNADRTITVPADIQPSAVDKPVAIVYDADGLVTDALIGTGANTDCFSNSAFGGPDAFTTDGHFAHALVILNGKCAQNSGNLPDLKYRLVRVFGQVFGLGWSQLNLDVISGSPRPSADEIAGLPVMHALDLSDCVPVSKCYTNADQPKLDDSAAISRLYPVTGANLAQFPGKQIFSASTGRIHGSVFFTDASGNATQPMQGVNVVARRINKDTAQPSGRYAATSVSGFLFAGNAGNAVTGYNDALGQPYNRFGSNDTSVQGFFDLAGLDTSGDDSVQYQLSIEPIDPNLSQRVGPYAPWQVQPSGSATPVIVTVSCGGDVQQDILMTGSAVDIPEDGEPESFSSPRTLPTSGAWMGSLSGYGDADYFTVTGQANRTLTVEVTALDENGQPTVQKAQPVLGMWSMVAPEGTPPPAYTSSSLNSALPGLTQLSVQLLESTQFRIGIADLRGDGRPDFRYRARVIYGNSVSPNRVTVRGSVPFVLEGTGFRPGMGLKIGNTAVTTLEVSSNAVLALAPALPDGVQDVTISDPTTSSSSTLTGALTIGAGPNDLIRLTQGGNSPTPVGSEAAYSIRVAVASSDGLTAISGATLQWSANNGAGLSACNGASMCYAYTDESGQAETRVLVGAVGTTNISASLAPGSYTPAKLVQAAVSGTSSAKDLVLLAPKVWVVQGATTDVPFTARLLANGVPLSGQTLKWQVGIGSGTPSPATVATDGDGYARSTVHVSNLTSDVQGTVCLAPANNPCQTFYIVQVASSVLKLQPVSGGSQVIRVGDAFQPIWVRVTNSATPPNPVAGVSVAFQSMTFLADADSVVETDGDSGSSQHAMKVLLGSSQLTSITNANGLATYSPATGGAGRPLDIEIMATAGTATPLQYELPVLPALPPALGASTGVARGPVRAQHRAPVRRLPVKGATANSERRTNAFGMSPPFVLGSAYAADEVDCSSESKSPRSSENAADATVSNEHAIEACGSAEPSPGVGKGTTSVVPF